MLVNAVKSGDERTQTLCYIEIVLIYPLMSVICDLA